MYHIEIPEGINQIIIPNFNRFGLWRNEAELSAFRKTGWKLLYLTFHVLYVLSVILGGITSDDRNESIFLIAGGTTASVISMRLFYILHRKEEICAFINDVGTHSVKDNEEFVKVSNKIKNLMKFSCLFVLGTFGTLTIFFISSLPIFTSDRRLPANIWLPLDRTNSAIVYWLAYAYLIIANIVNVIIISFNGIIWYLMMNCAIKYQILGNQLRNIDSTKSTVKKRKITKVEKQKLFLERLIGLMKTHRKIRESIDRFKSCFANLFFAQITTSGICICGSVYALAFGYLRRDLVLCAIIVTLLLYVFFDIFMVMYFGNEIMLSSDRLSYCLFESDWIEQSKSCKKCIVIVTEVLKQPHELVIGKLYPLTLETFTSILNLAYRMFHILQNLN